MSCDLKNMVSMVTYMCLLIIKYVISIIKYHIKFNNYLSKNMVSMVTTHLHIDYIYNYMYMSKQLLLYLIINKYHLIYLFTVYHLTDIKLCMYACLSDPHKHKMTIYVYLHQYMLCISSYTLYEINDREGTQIHMIIQKNTYMVFG